MITNSENIEDKIPKVFISYSWSSPEHEEWVMQLAQKLVGHGIEVVIDKWDLKEGQDINIFIEQMVNSDDIDKVLIISDKLYTEKANSRKGGVGKEALIISSEVYQNAKQTKFIGLVREIDEKGKAFLPIYFNDRYSIFLTEDDSYEEHYQQLIRCIYNKPQYIKPKLGNPPEYILENNKPYSQLREKLSNIRYSLINGKSNFHFLINDYFNEFIDEIKLFKMEGMEEKDNKKVLIILNNNLQNLIQYRDNFIELTKLLCETDKCQILSEKLNKFFEELLNLCYPDINLFPSYPIDYVHFKIFTYELYLYTISVLIKYQKFELADQILSDQFYFDNLPEDIDTFSFIDLNFPRNEMKHTGFSEKENLILERANNSIISLNNLIQTDYVLFIRSVILKNYTNLEHIDKKYWYPLLQRYNQYMIRGFEIFNKAAYSKYFSDLIVILGINNEKFIKRIYSIVITPLEILNNQWIAANNFFHFDTKYYNPEYYLKLKELNTK